MPAYLIRLCITPSLHFFLFFCGSADRKIAKLVESSSENKQQEKPLTVLASVPYPASYLSPDAYGAEVESAMAMSVPEIVLALRACGERADVTSNKVPLFLSC